MNTLGKSIICYVKGKERLKDRYKQDPKLSFVVKAIYTLAYGLHNLHQDLCGRDWVGVCPQLFPINGSLFKVRPNYFIYSVVPYFEYVSLTLVFEMQIFRCWMIYAFIKFSPHIVIVRNKIDN